MKKILLSLIITTLGTVSAFADGIFLKNGSVIDGTVTRQAGDTIVVKTGKSVKQFRRSQVLRILYFKEYRTRFIVKFSNGNEMTLYKVGEDGDGYIFRKNLTKNVEINAPKDRVVSMTSTEPKNLTASVYGTSVVLEWIAPPVPVKKYRIYRKDGSSFKKVKTVAGKKAEVKGLAGETEYSFAVRCVDKEGNESINSNLVAVKTQSVISQVMPKVAIKERRPSPFDKSVIIVLAWSLDPVARSGVKKFRVYQRVEGIVSMLGETEKEELVVKNINPGKRYRFMVRPIDKKGIESIDSGTLDYVDSKLVLNVSIYVRPMLWAPIFSYGEMYNPGVGILAGAALENIFMTGLNIGLETGYAVCWGATVVYDMNHIVPVQAVISYRYVLNYWLSFLGRISGGGLYNQVVYDRYGTGDYAAYSSFEPVSGFGVMASFDFHRMSIAAGIDWNFIFEKGSVSQYLVVQAGVTRRFEL